MKVQRLTNRKRAMAKIRRSVLGALGLTPMTVEQLGRRLGRTVGQLHELLAELEGAGLVSQQRQGQYTNGPLVAVWHVNRDGACNGRLRR